MPKTPSTKSPRSKSSNTITRNDLAAAVAAQRGCSRVDAMAILNAVIGEIKAQVGAGRVVQLRGFAAFAARNAPARRCRNPKTGAAVLRPARRVPRAKASKTWVLS